MFTFHQSKKSPTGPTERTPNSEYLIARSQLTVWGPLGFGPNINFWWNQLLGRRRSHHLKNIPSWNLRLCFLTQKRKDHETYSFERHLQELFKLGGDFWDYEIYTLFHCCFVSVISFQKFGSPVLYFTLELARFQLPLLTGALLKQKGGVPSETSQRFRVKQLGWLIILSKFMEL